MKGRHPPTREGDGRPLNVFVVGLDDFHLRRLESIRRADRYRFHPLLKFDQVVNPERYDLEALIEDGERELRSFDGPIDGIVGHWDFPTTTLVPILAERFGLRAPSLKAALRCEHKYWCRLEQRKVVPEQVPEFAAVDPFSDSAREDLPFEPPFWLKPVKAFSSYLGFKVRNRRDFDQAIQRTREGIALMAEPFNQALARTTLDPEVQQVDGFHCIAEQIIGGQQCTLEGYAWQGGIEIYGVIDSIRARNRSSFLRYDYPSRLKHSIQQRMIEAARRVMSEIGYDNGCFNIEFFHDRRHDRIWLLEINPRLSKSHCPLFELAEGASHHEPAVEIATGQAPDYPHGGARYRHSAKFMLRRFEDSEVTRVADTNEIRAIEERMEGVFINCHVEEGMRLSELPPQDQDSYSYELGVIFVGANTRRKLNEKYQVALEGLQLSFRDGAGFLAEEAQS